MLVWDPFNKAWTTSTSNGSLIGYAENQMVRVTLSEASMKKVQLQMNIVGWRYCQLRTILYFKNYSYMVAAYLCTVTNSFGLDKTDNFLSYSRFVADTVIFLKSTAKVETRLKKLNETLKRWVMHRQEDAVRKNLWCKEERSNGILSYYGDHLRRISQALHEHDNALEEELWFLKKPPTSLQTQNCAFNSSIPQHFVTQQKCRLILQPRATSKILRSARTTFLKKSGCAVPMWIPFLYLLAYLDGASSQTMRTPDCRLSILALLQSCRVTWLQCAQVVSTTCIWGNPPGDHFDATVTTLYL